jgi:ribosome-associated protein
MPAKKTNVRQQVSAAVAACQEKKAEELTVLELDQAAGSFTDYFVICTGSNPRQIQAISDEVEQRLSQTGVQATHVEGYNQAEWVLLDYVDFVVHVFSAKARQFYNLERLWKSAKQLTPSEWRGPQKKRTRAATAKSTSSAILIVPVP